MGEEQGGQYREPARRVGGLGMRRPRQTAQKRAVPCRVCLSAPSCRERASQAGEREGRPIRLPLC